MPRVINGFIRVGNKVAYDAENFKRTAEPIVASSAAAWRRTVDEEIAPAVAKVGEVTVNGLALGADKLAGAVMGEEKKEETKLALSTISRAIWNTETNNTETQTINEGYYPNNYEYDQQYYDYNQYSSEHEPSPSVSEGRNPQMVDSLVSDASNLRYNHHIDQYNNPVSVSDNLISSSFDFVTEEPNYSDFQPRNDPDIASISYTNSVNNDNPSYYDSSYLNNPNYNQNADNFYYQSSPNQQHNAYYNYGSNQHEPVMTVEEALYVLGKNILGRNVTDRIFPVAKQLAMGFGQGLLMGLFSNRKN